MNLSSSTERRRLLIIEDDAIISNVYRSRFEREGYEVEICADGQSGFYRLHESTFAAVVLDLMLPQMNGADILGKIRAQKRFEKLPVVVLTNAHLSQLADQARKAGANYVLSKSTTPPAQVVEAVNACLEGPTYAATGLVQVGGGRSLLPSGAESPAPLRQGSEPAGSPPAIADSNREPAWLLEPPSDAAGIRPTQEGRMLPYDAAKIPAKSAPVVNAPSELAQAQCGREPGVPAANNTPLLQTSGAPPRDAHTFIQEMRVWLKTLNKADDQPKKLACLQAMVGLVHPLAGSALPSDSPALRRLAEAFEALLWELYGKPTVITQSTLMTLAKTTDYLAQLMEHPEVGRDVAQPSVLVVDDDLFSRRATVKAMEKVQIKPTVEESPARALEQLQHTKFDLVITDVNMPGMSGFELCKQLRATPANRTTPVIFVTVQDDFERRTHSALSGGNELIGKPYLLMELAVKALGHVLRKPA